MAKKRHKKVSRARVKAKKPASQNRRAAKVLVPLYMPEPQISSYDEALLKGILANGKSSRTGESSLLFNSVLSTITPGIRNLYYRSGVSVGRSLYRLFESKRRYLWYEESVADLVSFFEKAGFSGITYNVFPDRIDIRFHNTSKNYLGTEIHVFESGIICGFLTAGRKQHVRVMEATCRCNGADECHFVTSDSLPLYLDLDGRGVLERFVSYARSDMMKDARPSKNVMEEYYMLSSSVFLDNEYSDHIKKVVYYMGSQIGTALNTAKLSRSRGSARLFEELFPMLNLGALKLKSIRPLDATIQFDRLKAKKEFVDISIAFLHGLVRQSLRQDSKLEVGTRRKGNTYIARITEKSKK